MTIYIFIYKYICLCSYFMYILSMYLLICFSYIFILSSYKTNLLILTNLKFCFIYFHWFYWMILLQIMIITSFLKVFKFICYWPYFFTQNYGVMLKKSENKDPYKKNAFFVWLTGPLLLLPIPDPRALPIVWPPATLCQTCHFLRFPRFLKSSCLWNWDKIPKNNLNFIL